MPAGGARPMLDRLLRRVRRPPAAPAGLSPPDTEAAAETAAERARRLVEGLLEDERLRGDLDDATWQPIQDWLLRAAERVAAATAGRDDAAAQPSLDAGRATLREMATTLADALGAGTGAADFAARLEPLHHLLRPPLVKSQRARLAHAALRDAAMALAASGADGPAAAAQLVAALEAGTTPRGDA